MAFKLGDCSAAASADIAFSLVPLKDKSKRSVPQEREVAEETV